MTTFAAFTDCVRTPTLFDACTATTLVSDQFGTSTRKSQLSSIGGRTCIQLTGLDSTLQTNWTQSTALALQADAESIYVLLYCSDPYLLEQGTATRVYWMPETSPGSNTTDGTNTLMGGVWSTEELGNQWVLCCVPFSLMTANGTATTTDQRSKKTMRIGVRVTVASGTKPDVYVGGIWIGGAQRSKVMLSYDGCYISQNTLVKPAHDTYGLTGTLYVAKSVVDSSASYLTTAQLDTFYAAGWSIAGHSYTGVALETLSESAMVDEIGNFRRWAQGRGYARGDGHWAWGYSVGTNNASAEIRSTVTRVLQQSGLKSLRVGNVGSGLTHMRAKSEGLSLGTIETGVKTICAPQLTSGLSIAQMRAFISSGIRHRIPVNVYCHEVAANQAATVANTATNFITPTNYDQTTTPGATQSWIPWLWTNKMAGLIDVVSIDDWYRGLTQPASVA